MADAHGHDTHGSTPDNHGAAPAAAPITFESATKEVTSLFREISKPIVKDLLPLVITALVFAGPFLSRRSRPYMLQFLNWLRLKGVDGEAAIEQFWTYKVPRTLQIWFMLAAASVLFGLFAQPIAMLAVGGQMSLGAGIFLLLTSLFTLLVYLIGYATVMKTKGSPSKAEIHTAVNGTDADWEHFLERNGTPSDPKAALAVLFIMATFVAIAHSYFVASTQGDFLLVHVIGGAIATLTLIGAGLAFQVVTVMFAKLGWAGFMFLFRPVAAAGRKVLVGALLGVTDENENEVLGPPTDFSAVGHFITYGLSFGAIGAGHIACAMVLNSQELLLVSGLSLIGALCVFVGYAFNWPKFGLWSAILLGGAFVIRALWGLFYGNYWRTVGGMSVTHGGAYASAIVINLFVALLIGGVVYLLVWLFTRNRWLAFVPALLVLVAGAPWLVWNVKKVADPTLATPREQQGAAALEDAAQNTIARGGQAISNGVNRRSDAWVNPPAPQPTPTPPRQEHRRRRRLAASTCPVYTGPGPCNGACQDFVRHNPRQCGL